MSHIFIPETSLFLTEDPRKNRWAIPYNFECLNARIRNLLWNHREAVEEKAILDLASHFGTFSYAALQLKANFVCGVDSEESLIQKASELFLLHEVDPKSYQFQNQTIESFLKTLPENSYDTVLCFGILYYLINPYGLLQEIKRVARETILLDTFTASYSAIQGKEALEWAKNIDDEILQTPLLFTVHTQAQKKDYLLPKRFPGRKEEISLTTYPTRALLELWFQELELEWQKLDWSSYSKTPCHWKDLSSSEQKQKSHWADVYSSGVRIAYRLSL